MSAPRFMPEQKPGRSVQEVGTPIEFLIAVVRRFGPIAWDLAANKTNKVAEGYFGPDRFQISCQDALQNDWWKMRGLLWLNPPYGNIAPWAAKCAKESHVPGDAPEGSLRATAAKIAFLVPASVGSNWFSQHVDGKALVLFLSPRLTFVGHTQSYPKDLILAVYGEKPGYECWRWKP